MSQTCPRCSTSLSADILGGGCPVCMLGDASKAPTVAAETPSQPPTTAPDFLIGGAVRSVGDYLLEEEIARGGMGVVYRARQRSLNRLVAVKMLLGGAFAGIQFLARFRREATSAARLRHPNIVPIFEIGEHEGHAYFSMELVEGGTLATLLHEGPLPPQRAAELLVALADAIHYAHEQGILHRDLKPSNVLLDADARPRITDFGLASDTAADVSLTATGDVLGTPAYMAPEQATGKSDETTRGSDVYSLGALLYHALTGRPPFQAGNNAEVMHQVIKDEPVAPRLLSPAVSADLNTICLKCLWKDPVRRYHTALELKEDLERFLCGEPIDARPAGRIENGWKWVKRRPGMAILGAAVVLQMLTLFVGGHLTTHLVKQARQPTNSASLQSFPPTNLTSEATPSFVTSSQPANSTITAPLAVKRWTNSLGQVFVPVPGTDVQFCIWHTRVQDYQAFAAETKTDWPKPTFLQWPTHPAVMVSWDDAQAFCKWLTVRERQAGKIPVGASYRLPQDWEWSVAVGLNEPKDGTPKDKHHKTVGVYPWGNQWPPPKGVGNYYPSLSVDEFDYTSPAGSFAANRFGLYDMGGNVWQWCEDLYSPESTDRVLRGASWGYFYATSLLSSYRYHYKPDHRFNSRGFRVVLVGGGGDTIGTKAVSPAQATNNVPVSLASLPLPSAAPRWTNSLGQVFVPVPGTEMRFSIWHTRVQDFAAFVKATGYDATKGMHSLKADGRRPRGDSWQSPGFAQSPTHPVCGVSWEDAQAFCRWLTELERKGGGLTVAQSFRLPQDWEWSVAAGLSEPQEGTPKSKNGKTKSVFPWGTKSPPPPGAGNFAGEEAKESGWPANYGFIAGYRDGFGRTSPVGSFLANQLGLYDMSGNLWQWCEDWFEPKYRVLRGGSWEIVNAGDLLSSTRIGRPPDHRRDADGFRVVLVNAGGGTNGTKAAVSAPSTDNVTSPVLMSAVPVAKRWTNSLGQVFVPVPGTAVRFCIWHTRVQDYQTFAKEVKPAWPNPSPQQGPTHPAVNVSWDDAQAYCQWLTEKERQAGMLAVGQRYRLPTDTEWSWAVGIGDKEGTGSPVEKSKKLPRIYPWGSQWPPPRGAGNYGPSLNVDTFGNTSPVGSFAPNAVGLYDIGGNVWQWCEDFYDASSGTHILRGASFNSYLTVSLLSSYRHNDRTEGATKDRVGFRVVLAGAVAPAVSTPR